MGYIYKITNKISGKMYIGCTKVPDVKTRWKQHIETLKRNQGCPALKDAFKKYGLDNFKFEVMFICFDDDVYEYEKQMIAKYNTQVPNGYNIGPGGIGGSFIGKKHTKETIDKIKEKLREKCKNWTDEERKEHTIKTTKWMKENDINIGTILTNSEGWKKAVEEKRVGSNSHKNVIRDENGNVHLVKETRDKISEAVKKYFNENQFNIEKHRSVMGKIYGIKIGQYDKEENLIKTYESMSDAIRSIGYKSTHSISKILDTDKLLKGCYWKKIGDANKQIYINKHKIKKDEKPIKYYGNCIKVNKYTLDGTFVEQFDSYRSATRSLNIKSESCVRRAIDSGKIYRGFIWKRVEKEGLKDVPT